MPKLRKFKERTFIEALHDICIITLKKNAIRKDSELDHGLHQQYMEEIWEIQKKVCKELRVNHENIDWSVFKKGSPFRISEEHPTMIFQTYALGHWYQILMTFTGVKL